MGNNLMLTMGAIVLFTVFLLSANSILLDNSKIADESEYTLTAVALAQSVIDEAKMKSFDEAGIGKVLTSRDSLTAPHSLGTDTKTERVTGIDVANSTGFQSMQKFDDVDDYDKYMRRVDTQEAD